MARKKDERQQARKNNDQAKQSGNHSPPPSTSEAESVYNVTSPARSKSQKGKKGGSKFHVHDQQNAGGGNHYFEPNDEHYIRFRNQLTPLGLMLRDVPPDGNCLFRALGDQLEGHGQNHFKHRMDVVRYMIQHSDDFAPFIDESITFEKYLDSLARDGTYGGQDSLVAFARLYKCNIVIHQLNSPMWQSKLHQAPISGTGVGNNSSGCHESNNDDPNNNSDNNNGKQQRGNNNDKQLDESHKENKSQQFQSIINNKPLNNDDTFLNSGFGAGSKGSDDLGVLSDGCPPPAFMDSATEGEDVNEEDSGAEHWLSDNPGGKKTAGKGFAGGVSKLSGAQSEPVGVGLGAAVGSIQDLDDVVQFVMENTGCFDTDLVRQTLVDHQLNTELTIDYLLNLMLLASSTNPPPTTGPSPPPAVADPADEKDDGLSRTSSIFLQKQDQPKDHNEVASVNHQLPNNKISSQICATQTQPPPNANYNNHNNDKLKGPRHQHLSNRERKNQKRTERLRRKEAEKHSAESIHHHHQQNQQHQQMTANFGCLNL